MRPRMRIPEEPPARRVHRRRTRILERSEREECRRQGMIVVEPDGQGSRLRHDNEDVWSGFTSQGE